ncbi:hypothetical protein GCM10007989_25900 [Devosia pacifica]|uniref:Uncharacterized protein n=1 Tax=Devosia pacifica TaxID=1335967 RepID=A0A918VU17_9HYPH|nr:hypothetical protein GCM10007989_25900 [Devosia pacifica]
MSIGEAFDHGIKLRMVLRRKGGKVHGHGPRDTRPYRQRQGIASTRGQLYDRANAWSIVFKPEGSTVQARRGIDQSKSKT